jgi:NAD-dependent deacetylase
MLLVGTSGTVFPAAAFPEMVKQRGGALVEANPLETHLSYRCDVVLRASAAESLPRLAARVRELRGERA